ncbi:MAG: hypothetical protein FWC54_05330 [Actinomycetia bacterium]|nr:hypothetical protein [Actinomycetes bacterium]
MKILTKKTQRIISLVLVMALMFGVIWVSRPFSLTNKQFFLNAAKAFFSMGPMAVSFGDMLYLGDMNVVVSNPTVVMNGDKAKLRVKVVMKSTSSVTDHVIQTNFVVQTAKGKIYLPTDTRIQTGGSTTDFNPGQQSSPSDQYTNTLFDRTLYYNVPFEDMSSCKVLLIHGLEYTDEGKLRVYAVFREKG